VNAIYNLVELDHNIEFVHHITIYPDLSYCHLILSHHAGPGHLSLNSDRHLPIQQLLCWPYIYTLVVVWHHFHLERFLPTGVAFHETEFTTSPENPLALMLHQRKTADTHDIFFRHVKAFTAATANCLIVTVGKQLTVQAIDSNLPTVQHLLCFNHILHKAKWWLHDQDACSADEVGYYLDCMRIVCKQAQAKQSTRTLLSTTSLNGVRYSHSGLRTMCIQISTRSVRGACTHSSCSKQQWISRNHSTVSSSNCRYLLQYVCFSVTYTSTACSACT